MSDSGPLGKVETDNQDIPIHSSHSCFRSSANLRKDGPFAQGQATASRVLQPEEFQHLVQPNSAEVSSVIGSHASTHAIAMIASLGNERPLRVSTNLAA